MWTPNAAYGAALWGLACGSWDILVYRVPDEVHSPRGTGSLSGVAPRLARGLVGTISAWANPCFHRLRTANAYVLRPGAPWVWRSEDGPGTRACC